MTKSWVSYIDIYAFQGHYNNNTRGALDRLHSLHSSVSSYRFGDIKYFGFSDTFIAIASGMEANGLDSDGDSDTQSLISLRSIVAFIKFLQTEASRYGFFLRGSVHFGEIIISKNFILGQAYIDCVKWEHNILVWPEVVIPDTALQVAIPNNMAAFPLCRLPVKPQAHSPADGGNSREECQVHIIKGLDDPQIEILIRAHSAMTLSASEKYRADEKNRVFWESYQRWIAEGGRSEGSRNIRIV